MNSLNKYTGINTENTENAEEGNSVNSVFPVFNPSYDADGNATQVQTSTGTWAVEYNAENRPVRWTNAATGTVITMTFDSQGRRTEYKSVTNGAQNTWLRFLSRDPIEEQGGLNLHAFVGNRVLSVVDNLGESQHGCNNVAHTEFQSLSDEEVNRRYKELSKKRQKTSADKEMLRKLKAEQKGRRLRHSRIEGFKCRGGFGSPISMAVQLTCTLIAMYIENELKEVERTEEESEGLMALSANCVRGVDGLWRCVCPSETTAYGAGDLSCKTFTNRPFLMCIKHNVDIPIQSLIGLVESNNAQVIKNENCCDE